MLGEGWDATAACSMGTPGWEFSLVLLNLLFLLGCLLVLEMFVVNKLTAGSMGAVSEVHSTVLERRKGTGRSCVLPARRVGYGPRGCGCLCGPGDTILMGLDIRS